jgi:hypothetical protein
MDTNFPLCNHSQKDGYKPTWEKEFDEIYYEPWGSHPADKLALMLSFIRSEKKKSEKQERTKVINEIREKVNFIISESAERENKYREEKNDKGFIYEQARQGGLRYLLNNIK